MDDLAAHRSAIRQFGHRVAQIRDDQWPGPTPNSEWNVTDLVEHLVYEQLWVPDLLAGQTIAEVGDTFAGDILGDDPKAAWISAAAAAQAAFAEPGALERTVHLSFGDVPATVYLWQMVVDLVVHGWDLAHSIQADELVPNDLLYATLESVKATMGGWSGSGLFASPIPVPGCTDDLTELLALTGRAR